MRETLRIRVLDLHAGYRCCHAGACCTAGWDIVADDTTMAAVAVSPRFASNARTRFRRVANASGEAVALLGLTEEGRCTFFEPVAQGSCAVQRELGHNTLPLACRQFPRVTLHDDRGVFVTLSHFCPTAAARLFEDGRTLAVVEAPDSFPSSGEYEGLDARGALPPLLRPDALHSLASHEVWTRFVLDTLDAIPSPDAALARIEAAAEQLRLWTIRDGDLDRFVDATLARHRHDAGTDPVPVDVGRSRAWWRLAVASVPEDAQAPPGPDTSLEWTSTCDAAWRESSHAIRRYLGAHAFANWAAYLGRGIRSEVRTLRVALEVARVGVARQAMRAPGGPPNVIVTEALRQADLVLRHLVDPRRLAQALDRLEARPLGRHR